MPPGRARRRSARGSPSRKRQASRRGRATSRSARRWSQRVTQNSNALDLEPGVFSRDDPRAIARSLRRSAEKSRRRKSDPYRSAMSMLVFYINRAGKALSRRRKATLEKAKEELRALYGRPQRRGPARRSA
jgi:hypothetical protein